MNYQEQETVPCRTCGDATPMLGTQLCNSCYDLRNGGRALSARARRLTAENVQLRARVRELEEQIVRGGG